MSILVCNEFLISLTSLSLLSLLKTSFLGLAVRWGLLLLAANDGRVLLFSSFFLYVT